MKVINTLTIIDGDNIKKIYQCNYKRNTKCKGYNNCRECSYTTKIKYAKDISRIELIKELEKKNKEIEDYKETIKRMINNEDIFEFKTINQIRKIYNLRPIN